MKKYNFGKFILIFFLSISLLIGASLLNFFSTRTLVENFQSVDHTNEVLIQLEGLFSSLKELETNVRGFVLTQDNSFLDKYHYDKNTINEEFKKLQFLTNDNPKQQKKLALLNKLLIEKYLVFDLQIKLRRDNGADSQKVFLTQQGKKITDRIRSAINVLEEEERNLLGIRKNNFFISESNTSTIIVIVSVVSILIIGMLFFVLLKEIKERLKAESEIIKKDQTIEKIREFEFLSNAIPNIICTSEADGTFNYYNDYFYQFVGAQVSKEGFNIFSIVHPQDLSSVLSIWNKSLLIGEVFECELRFRKSDGNYRWHIGRALPMYDKDTKIRKWFLSFIDIHDLKDAQEKERNSSLLYKLVIESVKDYAIFLLNTEGLITTWNKGAQKMFGYEPSEILGKDFTCIIDSESDGMNNQKYELKDVLESGRVESEGWRVKKDRSIFWANVIVTPVYDGNGTLVGYSKFVKDLTERKHAEEKMKLQNEELQAFRDLAIDEMQKKTQMLNGIVSNMPVGLFRIDNDGIITESYGKGWGKFSKTKNLQGKNILELDPELVGTIEKVTLGNREYIQTITSDGEEIFFENYLFPDNVTNKGIIGFSLDITEKKLAENRIKESEEVFRNLLDSAPDSMIIINEKGVIEIVNSQTLMLFKYNKEELTGQNIQALIPGNISFDETIWKKFIEGSNVATFVRKSYDLFAKRKDGIEFPVEVSISPLHTKSGILICAAIRDITERKVAERELQKAKHFAEKASEFKSVFLANMSHEIRTPLNAIIGFADVLKNQQLSSDQLKEYVDYISSSGNLLLKLIGDILDISKIEEGKLELMNESFFFKELISSGIHPYKYKANEKGLDFVLDIDSEIPAYLIGDPYRIKQVIVNLIGNALKFTKEGNIKVKVSNVPAGKPDVAGLYFQVSDSGIGIPKEKQRAIFDTFIQADDSIIREFGGSGLGLSIVKKLVSMMGSEIKVESPFESLGSKSPGTCFSFLLELKIDKSKTRPVINESLPTEDMQLGKEVKILVVEDNIVNQRLAKVVLKKMGCTVEFANNGKEAIDKVKEKEYSIVLMDVQMPVMDGYQATKLLRKEYNYLLPIVGLTANVFKEDIENCLIAGMNDYLGKPYSEVQIYNIIKKWIA